MRWAEGRGPLLWKGAAFSPRRAASRRRAGVKEKSCGARRGFFLRGPRDKERMENMQKNKVAVIMGSDSDLPVVGKRPFKH